MIGLRKGQDMKYDNQYNEINYIDVYSPEDSEKNNFYGEVSAEANLARVLLAGETTTFAKPLFGESFEISPYIEWCSNISDEPKEYILKFIDSKYIDDFCTGTIHTTDMTYIRKSEIEDIAQGDIYEGVLTTDNPHKVKSISIEGRTFTKFKRWVAVAGTISKNENGESKYDLLDRQGIICAVGIKENMVDEFGKLKSSVLESLEPIANSRPFILTTRENFERSIYEGILYGYGKEHKAVLFGNVDYFENKAFRADITALEKIARENRIYQLFFRKRKRYESQSEFRVLIEATHDSNLNNRNLEIKWHSPLKKYEYHQLNTVALVFD